MLNPRGVTMLEMLIALTLFGVVAPIATTILVRTLRAYSRQTRQIDEQQQRRALTTVLPAELRALDAADGDIGAMSETAIDLRGSRWLGVTCSALTSAPPAGDPGLLAVTMRRRLFFGVRDIDPQADSVLIYDAGATMGRDPWRPGQVGGVAPATCDDGEPGVRLRIAMDPTDGRAFTQLRRAIGLPLRGFTRVQYRLYRPAGDSGWYVGIQEAGGGLQPLAGPLLRSGFELRYVDADGIATVDPRRVARIDVWLRSASGADSFRTTVALRNNRRLPQ